MPRHLLSTDSEGKPIVLVHLSNSDAPAVVDLPDYERVVNTLGNGRWLLNGCALLQYVRAYDPKRQNYINIARLIAGAQSGSDVCYRDGDRLNLRSQNLHFRGGTGGVKRASRRARN